MHNSLCLILHRHAMSPLTTLRNRLGRLLPASWLRTRSLGERGEQAAARYLRRKRYIIVGRGQRSRLGEIDIIAVDGRTLVFVEVKTRHSHEAGHPSEAITRAKQHKLSQLALVYLKRHQLLNHPARFDVVAVTWSDDRRRPTLEHYVNAFEFVATAAGSHS